MNEDRILIEVEVDTGKSAEDLANVRSRVDALKDAQKRLKTEMKELQAVQLKNGQMNAEDAKTLAELNRQYADNSAELKQLTAQEKVYTSQIQIATQNDRKYGDSIIELGAQLAQLKQQYRSLSAAQRESEAGKAMLENIQNLDKAVKEADYSLGDFGRNVGNYTSALLGLNGNVAKVAGLFQTGLTAGLKTAGTALKSFGKTLLTTPFGWILAGVAAVIKVFQKLREAFKANDVAGTQLSAALARLQPIADAIGKLFSALAETVAKLVNGVTNVATIILSKLIPSYNDAANAAYKLKVAQDKLEDSERQYVINHAKYQSQIADLQAKAAQRDKYTREQRLQFYDESIELEKKDLAEKKRIAAEKYNQAVKAAKQQLRVSVITAEAYERLDDSIKDNLANLKAAYISIDAEMSDFMRSQQKRRQGVIKEMDAEGKQQAEAAKKSAEKRKAALKAETEEIRKLEDLRLKFVKNEYERQIKEAELSYNRQIEDIEKRLKEESKNLTKSAIAALKDQIVELGKQRDKAIEELNKKKAKTEQEALDNALDALTFFDKKFGDVTDSASFRGIKAAENVLKAYEGTGKQMSEWYEKQERRYANSVQERLNAVYGNVVEAANIELEVAQNYYDSLVGMDVATRKAMFKNEEDYKAAVLAAEAQIQQAQTKTQQALQQQTKEVADTMKAVTGALSDLFEAAAGDSETYAKFKKAMAIVDATISLAQTIAAATAISASEGDAYTMAIRIAANVAAVTAQFAAVIKAIKAASIPSAPSFERGGIVPGTSYTGDNVTTRLNSREMVLTLQQQGNLFDLINAGFPRGGIDYRRLAAAFAEGAAQLPAPVLAYREFKAFERDVRFSEQKMFND